MSPEAPSSPSRLPATLNDWQGLPPTTTSTNPLRSLQSILVMSPKFGIDGNLSSSTALGNGSISEKHTGTHPSGDHATVADSIPENVLT